MFGFIIPNFKTLNENEKSRYQSLYCGLCHALRDNYSNVSRLALSYDLTFLVMLLSSLYEPKETKENCNCVFHPGNKFTTAQNQWSEYCADVTIALAYHKILDDIKDDDSLKAKISKRALSSQYKIVESKNSALCKVISHWMNVIQQLEEDPDETSGDEIAKTFGMITAHIFAPLNDVFFDDLTKFGSNLGRFIYFMDAAFDCAEDKKSGNYNPFQEYLNGNTEITKDVASNIKQQLMTLAGTALHYFEKLPLEQDIHILQNILYEGMWIRFNQKYLK